MNDGPDSGISLLLPW